MNFSQLKWQHWMPDLAQQAHPLSPQSFIVRWPTIAPRIPATTAQTRPSDHHSQGKTSARPCDWRLKFPSDVFWKAKDISINPKVSECFCAEHWNPTLFWFFLVRYFKFLEWQVWWACLSLHPPTRFVSFAAKRPLPQASRRSRPLRKLTARMRECTALAHEKI